MANSSTRARTLACTVAASALVMLFALYLTGLTRMGMYSTDEPRYADIGRAMARTGDWITPRLWGQPWFEKPPLLYWMTATGFRVGLSTDLAPRLPVAILSVAFLIFFWVRLRALFDLTTASFSTAILATSAGWLAYSHVAVTDLPLTVFFTTSVLFALPASTETQPPRAWSALALGLAVLAKSLPPLVLFLPLLILDRREWRRWFAAPPLFIFLAVALPWHILATLRNGWNFIYVLFIQQQFGRFLNSSRQHGQPFWFYAPILLLLLFPWFPLLGLAVRHLKSDRRTQSLAAIAITGFVFFSASVNKLPGYVLPLVPSLCILMGLGLARNSVRERWLIAPVVLLGMLPAAATDLPVIAAHGFRASPIPWAPAASGCLFSVLIALLLARTFRCRSFIPVSLLAAIAFLWLEITLFPAMDASVSARTLWLANRPVCAGPVPRGILYGLDYYAEKELPPCGIVDKNTGH